MDYEPCKCGSVSVLFKDNNKPPYLKEEIKQMEKKRKALLKEIKNTSKISEKVKKENIFKRMKRSLREILKVKPNL